MRIGAHLCVTPSLCFKARLILLQSHLHGMIFYSHDIKLTHFHKKGFALSLILKNSEMAYKEFAYLSNFTLMHFLVSILKIRILLFLKLFGKFFMKFLCYVDLLRSLNSGGKWVKHPNRPYPLHPTHSKIPVKHLNFQETAYQNFGQVGVQVSCGHN